MSATMDDEADDLKRWARNAIIIGGLLVVSLFQSCRELTYIASGAKIEATIDRAYEVTRRGRWSTSKRIEIDYAFQAADGQSYRGSATVAPSDWKPSEEGRVAITYLPSDPRISTLTSERSRIWILVLFAILGVIGYGCWRIWAQAGDDAAKARRYAKAS